jgi:hypothetical protein
MRRISADGEKRELVVEGRPSAASERMATEFMSD